MYPLLPVSPAQPASHLKELLSAAGGVPMIGSVAKRAQELVEAGLPQERPGCQPPSTLMGFPSVQAPLTQLRRAEVRA